MYASENLLKSEYDDNIRQHFIVLALQVITCIVGIIFILLIAFNPLTAHAEEANGKYVYNFNAYAQGYKYDLVLSSDYPCVAQTTHYNIAQNGNVVGGYMYDNYKIDFYTLDSSGNAVLINPYVLRAYERVNNVWTSSDDLSYEYGERQFASSASGRSTAFDFSASSLKCLYYTNRDFEYITEINDYDWFTVGQENVSYYLKHGVLKEVPHDTNAYALSNTFYIPLSRYWYTASDNYKFYLDNTSDFSLSNVSITDDGVITWDTPIVPNGCKFAGVSVYFHDNSTPLKLFYKNFRLDHSIKVNPHGIEDFSEVYLYPYYITSDGCIVYPRTTSFVKLDKNASYFNREGEYFTQYAINDAVEGVKPSYDKDFVPSRPHGGGGGNFDNGDRYMSTTTLIASGTKERLDGYEQRNDFYLKNVKVKTGLGGFTKTITWDGTSLDGTLSNIPSSDSLTLATYGMYDSNGEYHVFELDSVETSKGKIKINYSEFIDEMSASPYTWDGLINISPTYKFNHKIFMGRQTVVDLLHGGIKEWYYDDNGEFVDEVIRNDTEDIGDSSSDGDGDGILGSLNDFISSVGSFSQFTGTFFGFLQSVVASMGNFPSLFNTVFGFLPSMYASAIGTFLVVILILRILGR